MKLREIIKKLKQYGHKRMTLKEHMQEYCGNSLIEGISLYVDYFLLSKREATMLLKTLEDEIKDLRCRVDELENELDLATQSSMDDIGSSYGGLTPEEIELIDEMIAEEYFSNLYEEDNI